MRGSMKLMLLKSTDQDQEPDVCLRVLEGQLRLERRRGYMTCWVTAQGRARRAVSDLTWGSCILLVGISSPVVSHDTVTENMRRNNSRLFNSTEVRVVYYYYLYFQKKKKVNSLYNRGLLLLFVLRFPFMLFFFLKMFCDFIPAIKSQLRFAVSCSLDVE